MLIGVVITSALSASRERRARLAAAAVAFRAAVLGELEGLYPIPVAWPSDVDGRLRAAFPKLQSAVSEFKHFLPWYRRRGFDKAWFLYRVGKGGREIDKQCYHQYMAFGSNRDPQGTFRHNVDRLLSYAKRT